MGNLLFFSCCRYNNKDDYESRKDVQKIMKWQDESAQLLDELMKPQPVFVRPMAKKSIKSKVEQVAQQAGAEEVNKDHVVRGYIMAAPDKSRAVTALEANQIDLSPYADLLK